MFDVAAGGRHMLFQCFQEPLGEGLLEFVVAGAAVLPTCVFPFRKPLIGSQGNHFDSGMAGVPDRKVRVFGRGKRNVEQRKGRCGIGAVAPQVRIVIRRGVDPDVRTGKSQIGGALVETGVQAEVGHGMPDGTNIAGDGRAAGCVRWEQLAKCVERSGIAHNHGSAEFAPIRHPDSVRAAGAVQHNLVHFGANDDLAAGPLNYRCDGRGNLRCASHRITGTIEIMRGDGGVHGETALGRRQAVVAPLSCQYAGQLAIRGDAGQHFRRGGVGPAQEWSAHPGARQPGSDSRNRFFRKIRVRRFYTGEDRGEITIYSRAFGGERLEQAFAKTVHAAREFVRAIRDANLVVNIGHRIPCQPAFREMIESGAQRRGRILYLTDVVETDIPFVAGPMEGVRESAGGVVALQDQNTLAGMFGEQRGSSQPTDAGADYNRVPELLDRDLFV